MAQPVTEIRFATNSGSALGQKRVDASVGGYSNGKADGEEDVFQYTPAISCSAGALYTKVQPSSGCVSLLCEYSLVAGGFMCTLSVEGRVGIAKGRGLSRRDAKDAAAHLWMTNYLGIPKIPSPTPGVAPPGGVTQPQSRDKCSGGPKRPEDEVVLAQACRDVLRDERVRAAFLEVKGNVIRKAAFDPIDQVVAKMRLRALAAASKVRASQRVGRNAVEDLVAICSERTSSGVVDALFLIEFTLPMFDQDTIGLLGGAASKGDGLALEYVEGGESGFAYDASKVFLCHAQAGAVYQLNFQIDTPANRTWMKFFACAEGSVVLALIFRMNWPVNNKDMFRFSAKMPPGTTHIEMAARDQAYIATVLTWDLYHLVDSISSVVITGVECDIPVFTKPGVNLGTVGSVNVVGQPIGVVGSVTITGQPLRVVEDDVVDVRVMNNNLSVIASPDMPLPVIVGQLPVDVNVISSTPSEVTIVNTEPIPVTASESGVTDVRVVNVDPIIVDLASEPLPVSVVGFATQDAPILVSTMAPSRPVITLPEVDQTSAYSGYLQRTANSRAHAINGNVDIKTFAPKFQELARIDEINEAARRAGEMDASQEAEIEDLSARLCEWHTSVRAHKKDKVEQLDGVDSTAFLSSVYRALVCGEWCASVPEDGFVPVYSPISQKKQKREDNLASRTKKIASDEGCDLASARSIAKSENDREIAKRVALRAERRARAVLKCTNNLYSVFDYLEHFPKTEDSDALLVGRGESWGVAKKFADLWARKLPIMSIFTDTCDCVDWRDELGDVGQIYPLLVRDCADAVRQLDWNRLAMILHGNVEMAGAPILEGTVTLEQVGEAQQPPRVEEKKTPEVLPRVENMEAPPLWMSLIPTYGNFGGPGHTDLTRQPIDELDEAYMYHDLTWGAAEGSSNAEALRDYANNVLVAAIDSILARGGPGSAYGRIHATLARAIFSNYPTLHSTGLASYGPTSGTTVPDAETAEGFFAKHIPGWRPTVGVQDVSLPGYQKISWPAIPPVIAETPSTPNLNTAHQVFVKFGEETKLADVGSAYSPRDVIAATFPMLPKDQVFVKVNGRLVDPRHARPFLPLDLVEVFVRGRGGAEPVSKTAVTALVTKKVYYEDMSDSQFVHPRDALAAISTVRSSTPWNSDALRQHEFVMDMVPRRQISDRLLCGAVGFGTSVLTKLLDDGEFTAANTGSFAGSSFNTSTVIEDVGADLLGTAQSPSVTFQTISNLCTTVTDVSANARPLTMDNSLLNANLLMNVYRQVYPGITTGGGSSVMHEYMSLLSMAAVTVPASPGFQMGDLYLTPRSDAANEKQWGPVNEYGGFFDTYVLSGGNAPTRNCVINCAWMCVNTFFACLQGNLKTKPDFAPGFYHLADSEQWGHGIIVVPVSRSMSSYALGMAIKMHLGYPFQTLTEQGTIVSAITGAAHDTTMNGVVDVFSHFRGACWQGAAALNVGGWYAVYTVLLVVIDVDTDADLMLQVGVHGNVAAGNIGVPNVYSAVGATVDLHHALCLRVAPGLLSGLKNDVELGFEYLRDMFSDTQSMDRALKVWAVSGRFTAPRACTDENKANTFYESSAPALNIPNNPTLPTQRIVGPPVVRKTFLCYGANNLGNDIFYRPNEDYLYHTLTAARVFSPAVALMNRQDSSIDPYSLYVMRVLGASAAFGTFNLACMTVGSGVSPSNALGYIVGGTPANIVNNYKIRSHNVQDGMQLAMPNFPVAHRCRDTFTVMTISNIGVLASANINFCYGQPPSWMSPSDWLQAKVNTYTPLTLENPLLKSGTVEYDALRDQNVIMLKGSKDLATMQTWLLSTATCTPASIPLLRGPGQTTWLCIASEPWFFARIDETFSLLGTWQGLLKPSMVQIPISYAFNFKQDGLVWRDIIIDKEAQSADSWRAMAIGATAAAAKSRDAAIIADEGFAMF